MRPSRWVDALFLALLACTFAGCGSREAARIAATKAVLDRTRLPTVEFNEANVADVINFIQFTAGELASESGDTPPVFLLDLELSGRLCADSRFVEREEEPELWWPDRPLPLLTLTATNVSILELLEYLESTNACRYEILGGMVILRPHVAGKPPAP